MTDGLAITVAGEGARLTLHVRGWSYPDATDVDDGNWLDAEATLTSGEFGSYSARQSVTVRATELSAFHDALATLLTTLDGVAELCHIEDEVGARATLRRGRGEVELFVADPSSARLEVGVETNQSYLAHTLRDLRAVVSAFPPR